MNTVSRKISWINFVTAAAVFFLFVARAESQGNQPPIADAGPDRTTFVGQSVMLLGSATDPNNDPIVTWNWTVVSSPAGSSPSVPEFDQLREDQPKHVGLVYQCDACLAPVFLRFAVKQYSENAIELYRNYIELERPEERFAFSYLPQHTETWRASS